MIKVNLRNGKTLSFDLKNPIENIKWVKMLSQNNFQKQISGIGIIFNSQWYVLPIPKKFKQISFHAELVKNTKKNIEYIGEKIKVYADDVTISILVYYGKHPKMCRFDIIKNGKCRFNPALKEV